MRITNENVLRLAKSILASHMMNVNIAQPRPVPVPWARVEEFWKQADHRERAHYRFEARQVLRTLDAARRAPSIQSKLGRKL